MLKAYKTEIDPTDEQKLKIRQTIGVCRFIYNFYIAHNKQEYKDGNKFMGANDFSKWMNNEYLPEHPELSWIKSVSTKAVKEAMRNGEVAYRKFFKGVSEKPKFKKKKKQMVKAYFPKNNPKDFEVERHRIKVPMLGFVRIKEKGYIPVNSDVRSATVSQKADRYYISVLVNGVEEDPSYDVPHPGVGIDLGLRIFACVSDGQVFENLNKTESMIKVEKKLRREQRSLSRKYEAKKKSGSVVNSNNLNEQILVVQKLHVRLSNMRNDYLNQVVSALVKTKSMYVTIEDLNVRGMMKNRHVSKAISKQGFGMFKTKLIQKCKENNIEVRIVDRWYPSSKICSDCGHKKEDLTLADRVFQCPNCGLEIDRDLNASINLANAKEYTVA